MTFKLIRSPARTKSRPCAGATAVMGLSAPTAAMLSGNFAPYLQYQRSLSATNTCPTLLALAGFVYTATACTATARGPAFASVDVAISERFPIFEGSQPEIRGEAFNARNHHDSSDPNTSINSTSTVGHTTSTGNDARLLQVAPKIII